MEKQWIRGRQVDEPATAAYTAANDDADHHQDDSKANPDYPDSFRRWCAAHPVLKPASPSPS